LLWRARRDLPELLVAAVTANWRPEMAAERRAAAVARESERGKKGGPRVGLIGER
jgi:hypothetical protein